MHGRSLPDHKTLASLQCRDGARRVWGGKATGSRSRICRGLEGGGVGVLISFIAVFDDVKVWGGGAGLREYSSSAYKWFVDDPMNPRKFSTRDPGLSEIAC